MTFKKAQAEMVGLLVIVLLLLFIGIIFLRFYLLQPSTSLDASRQNLDGQHLLQGLPYLSFTGILFPSFVQECHATADRCTVLQDELETFFTLVLPAGRQYFFSLSTEENELLHLGTCLRGIASTSTFSEEDTFYTMTLRLC